MVFGSREMPSAALRFTMFLFRMLVYRQDDPKYDLQNYTKIMIICNYLSKFNN